MVVYIAGPISKGDTIGHVRNACAAWQVLRGHGFVPICPHWSIVQEMHAPMTHDQWLDYDFKLIGLCGALLRLPGESVGADKEVEFAQKIGVPVFRDYNSLFAYVGRHNGTA